ncbi:MAG: UvrB/UvrC motif-containing protein [bacterium]|nr:UvrB/UvrC motif-containing protein [bacterium]
MRCHRCGQREASVHWLEIAGETRHSVWLCADCAASGERETPPAPGPEPEPLVSFLGRGLAPGPAPRVACPGCGTTLEDLRRDNRLGCAACYTTFRATLLPLLARFHRHVSHVGKVPGGARPATRLAEITKMRLALTKAVAAEEFERAAGLRDRLRELEDGESGDGREA